MCGLSVFSSRGEAIGQVALNAQQMAAACQRRWQHMPGRREIFAWAIGKAERLASLLDSPSLLDQAFATPRRGVAFWHGKPSLPDAVYEGFKTATSIAQLRVELLCYERPANVPPNVEVLDAHAYLDWATAETYMKAHGVQFVAGLVRARALLLGGVPGGGLPSGRVVYRRRRVG